jgi:ATP-dependent RNA helicase DeaD
VPESDREPTGAARAAGHSVHVLARDARGDERICRAALERLGVESADDEGDSGHRALEALVLAPDAESAMALARASHDLADTAPGASLVPLTAAGRGARLLRAGGIRAAVTTPRVAAALRQSAALKMDDVAVIVLAWASDLLEAGEGDALDSLLADAPRESARVVVTSQLSDGVRELVSRHARRARPAAVAEADAAEAVDLRYVETSAVMRNATLRRLLDEIDPPTAIVVAWGDDAAAAATRALGTMGYRGDDALVRVSRGEMPEHVTLAVLYDVPGTPAELAAVGAANPTHLVALVTRNERSRLQALSSGTITPWVASPAVARARARADKLRDTLRAELGDAFPAREVLALEPLLDEFDGVEIAAAALRLYERERTRASTMPAPAVAARTEAARDAAPPPARVAGAYTRIFLSIGNDDGVRPGDLVGAITGESGITSSDVGKIDIRDRHSLVEIASHLAPRVIEKMTGVTVKGRRVMAREDRGVEGGPREHRGGDRPPRPGKPGFRDRERPGGRPPARRGASDRDDRPFRGGPRSGGDRPFRGGGGSRGGADRPFRSGGGGPRSGGDRPFRGGGGSRGGADRPFRGGGQHSGANRPFRGGGDVRPFRGGGPPDRDERRGPRARGEQDEWSQRGDRVRNARGRRHEGG